MEATNNNCSGGGGYNVITGLCECEYCSSENNNSGKTIDELIAEVENRMTQFEIAQDLAIAEIKERQEAEFVEEGEDITDSLPTMDEALKLREENEKLKDELSKFKEQQGKGGVWEEITNANDGLAKKLTELLKENEKLKKNECLPCSDSPPPFPEPPQGAPFLWRNAMCRHFEKTGKCDYKEKCGYAHSIEEAQYYQKRCNDYRVKWGEKIYSLNQQINELKLEIPDKKSKRLSPKDKLLLKEIINGVGWVKWEAHRKLLMRLLK